MANEEGNGLFRQKSLETISSPEDLHDYIRVTNPGVWLILSAIIILLAGFIVWGICGEISTEIDAVCVTDGGKTVCYISEENANEVQPGMKVTLADGSISTVSEINGEALDAGNVLSEYAMHVAGFAEGIWVHELTLADDLDNGTCAASVTVDSVRPISFIFN